MGLRRPPLPDTDGDASAEATQTSDPTLVASERGGNAARRLETDIDRNLHVSVTKSPGSEATAGIRTPGSETNVTADTITTVVTHTVTANTLYLDGFVATGQYDAVWTVVFDNVTEITYRTSEQDRTFMLFFPTAQPIAVGVDIDIKVKHCGPVASTGDFTATIIGHERT